MVSASITGQAVLGDSGATQALVDQAARAHGLSKSRCVAEIIRKYPAHEWPQDCLALAGRFADFPLRDAEGAKAMTTDSSRAGCACYRGITAPGHVGDAQCA